MLPLMNIFQNKLKHDTRTPLILLETNKTTLSLLLPNTEFWLQVAVLYIIQSILGLILSILIYKFIIQQRISLVDKTQQHSLGYKDFFIGYGVIIPIAILLPYKIINYLELENRTLRFSLVCLPNAIVFRCLEAMYNCSPALVETSLLNYCTYSSSILEILYCPKTKSPKRITNDKLSQRITSVAQQLLLLILFYSILHPYKFQYIKTALPPDSINHTIYDIFSFGHNFNNIIYAILVYLVLCFSSDLMALGINILLRYDTIKFMNDPLTSSTSPSDFWSRRWNMVIHNLLKRGVFIPTKKHFGRNVAMILSFVVSGLMHEYAWSIIFYQADNNQFVPMYGKNMLFFTWNGVIIFLEYQIGHLFLFQWMKGNLPVRVRTFLVIMTSIPISHLYSGDWIVGDYFQDFVHGIPMIVMS